MTTTITQKNTSKNRVRWAEKTGTCLTCRSELSRTREPVTVSGWYGDFRFSWHKGLCLLDDAECVRCRVRRAHTPVDQGPGSERYVGRWTIGDTAGASWKSFTSFDAAMSYLHALALEEDRTRAGWLTGGAA